MRGYPIPARKFTPSPHNLQRVRWRPWRDGSAVDALLKDSGLVPSTHTVTHNHLYLGIGHFLIHTNIRAKHSHITEIKYLKEKKGAWLLAGLRILRTKGKSKGSLSRPLPPRD